jgi:ABC-2 type transport system ATP-binding protein
MALVSESDPVHFQEGKLEDQVIIAHNLEKKFAGEYAVREATFSVPRGTIFGFIGPSGSGKTTTIRLLNGIYNPSGGEVLVLGQRPEHFSQGLRAKIGYMPQLFVLYPNLTVWENLSFTASIYGMGWGRTKRMNQVLEFVELSEHKNKLTRNISGGMQRRLTLAATLVHRPELIFLDEPTAGVDPVLRRKFWDHFRNIQNQGRTLFVTTQYVSEAAYCDWVGVMANGKLLMVDTPDGLRHRAYGGEMVDMRTGEQIGYQHEDQLQTLPFIRGPIQRLGPDKIRLIVDESSTAMPDLMDWSRERNIKVESIEEYLPPFDDVFVELVKDEAVNE